MNLDFRQVATELARAHRSADTQTTLIKLCGSPTQSEIYLLEVSKSAPTTYRGSECANQKGLDYHK